MAITDEILRRILYSHFFFGDLTGSNFGVVLETGIALSLKPNERVLIFTQDDAASLHFDLKVTKVNDRYTEATLVADLAVELVKAADALEAESDRYIRLLSSQLTPDAHAALNVYGRLWKSWSPGQDSPSIFEGVAAQIDPIRFGNTSGSVAFHGAIRELLTRRLFWTQYSPNARPGVDLYGIHATALGWRVIEDIWQHDPQMRQPSAAPIRP